MPERAAASAQLTRRSRRLLVALAINGAIVVGQVVAGLAASSVGLLADAAHNLADVAAIGLAFVALRMTRRPPDRNRSFGYHRSTVLAAQANAAFLIAVTAIIGYEAVLRLLHPHSVKGGVVAAVAFAALLANGAAALVVFERGRHDLNTRAVILHLAGDAAASAGVAIAGLVILVHGGVSWVDPAVSLAVAVLIAVQSYALVRDTTDVLLESTPSGLDMGEVVEAMLATRGVEDVHDVHAWSLSSEVYALSAHVVLLGHPTLEEAQLVSEAVKAAIAAPFGIAHATLDLECETCISGNTPPCAMDNLSPAGMTGAVHRIDFGRVRSRAGSTYRRGMCRSIVTLRGEEPATDDEVQAAALQFIRKVSGQRAPSRANQEVFDQAVHEVAHATRHLLDQMVSPPGARPPAMARSRIVARSKLEARTRAGTPAEGSTS